MASPIHSRSAPLPGADVASPADRAAETVGAGHPNGDRSSLPLRPLPAQGPLAGLRRRAGGRADQTSAGGEPTRQPRSDHLDATTGNLSAPLLRAWIIRVLGPAAQPGDLGASRLLGGGDPPLPDGAEEPGRIDQHRRPRQKAMRLVGFALAVITVPAVAWWLLKPPSTPVELSLPSASTAEAPPSGAAASSGAAEVAGAMGEGAELAVTAHEATGGGTAPGAGEQGGGDGSAASSARLVVHASGAVASPGVYRVPAGSRVDDLIRASGGLSLDADVDRVNLAAPLVDGERIWVPRKGDTDVPDVVTGGTVSAGPARGSGGSGGGGPGDGAVMVNLNTATAEELDSLPGVGPATAASILAYRDQNGPLSSVDELIEVRGIGEAKLEQIRPLVTT